MKGNIQVQNRKLSSLIANIPGNPYLYIYSGTMPTASDSFTTSTYTSSQLLAFTLSGGWYGYDTTDTAYTSFYMTQFPASAPASLSGTASWFCLYSSPTIFVLGDVSDTTGTSVLQLLTSTIVSGIYYDIYSFAFKLYQ